jgi:hypothetical protein
MYSVLRDPAVCVLPGGDYSKLVDGSAFATDINHYRQPYNVFVVDDDDERKDIFAPGYICPYLPKSICHSVDFP